MASLSFRCFSDRTRGALVYEVPNTHILDSISYKFNDWWFKLFRFALFGEVKL